MKLRQIISAVILSVGSMMASAAQIDINVANAETIAKSLRGVGPTKAAAIVKYRETNGKFKSVDDLVKVKGIGKKTVDANRANLSIVASSH